MTSLYYRRIKAQEASGKNISGIGQSVAPELDTIGIWNSMQLTLSQHRPIKNSIIRIELNPSPEHTSFYDIEDWQKLWHEFAEEFDNQTITGKDGKVRSSSTNLANSKYTVYLHMESKGKVPHLCKKQVFDQQFSEKLVSADFGKQLLHILIDKAVMRQRAAASLLGA